MALLFTLVRIIRDVAYGLQSWDDILPVVYVLLKDFLFFSAVFMLTHSDIWPSCV